MKNLFFSLFKKISNILSGSGLSKIYFLGKLYAFIYRIFVPEDKLLLTEIEGIKLYVSGKDKARAHSFLVEDNYEPYQTQIFKGLIFPKMTFVNIGAHIGYYALLAAKLMKNQGRIFAFEPDPLNFNLLLKNIKLNRFTNISVFQKAISNKRGRAKLFLNQKDLGKHSLSFVNAESDNFVEVETATLDDFFKEKKIDLILVDAEGAEGIILEGGKETIKKNRKIKLIVEFWPWV